MERQSVLLIDTDATRERLVDGEGRPVWPVRTEFEHDALRSFARKFRFDLQVIHGRSGSTEASSEVVVAWGEDVADEARLYAHLTKRRARVVSGTADLRDLHALRAATRPAVLVTTLSHLRNDLLDILYPPHSEGPAPGLICAPTVEQLRPQVLVRAAAATLSGPEGPRLSLSIGPLGASLPDPDAVELGLRRDPERLLQRLGEGAGIVSAMAHSDGVDAMLGRELILCPMQPPIPLVDPGRAPRCIDTGVCHRLRAPIAQALAGSRLVPPEALSAWCLVFGACWGVMPPDGVVDPAAGLAPRLLASPTLGAILTTWNVAPLSQDALEHLARQLHAGVSVGEALQAFHASPLARRTGLRFCLLGDPRLAVPPARRAVPSGIAAFAWARAGPYPSAGAGPSASAGAGSSAAAGAESPASAGMAAAAAAPGAASRRAIPGSPAADIAFLRAYLEDDASHVPPDLRPLAADVSAALERYAAAAATGAAAAGAAAAPAPAPAPGVASEGVEGGHAAPGPGMRRALIEYLAHRGPRVFSVWLPFAVPDEPEEAQGRRCPACRLPHNTLTTLEAVVDAGDGLRRRLSFCPRCGVVEDVPIDCDASLSIDTAQTLRLRYRRAFANGWAGVLVVRSQMPHDRMVWNWPAAANGRPARQFRPAEPWPVGPLDVGLMIVSDARLTILMQRARARAAAPTLTNTLRR